MDLMSELWNKDSKREVPGVLAVAIDEDRLVDIGHHGHVSFRKQELLHLLEAVSWRGWFGLGLWSILSGSMHKKKDHTNDGRFVHGSDLRNGESEAVDRRRGEIEKA